MTFIQSAILGLVQGLTEFIPVSSTGHLILFREVMDLPLENSLSFDSILQLATGLAVLIYFWRDIYNLILGKNRQLLTILIIGTLPAVVVGLFLESYMETVFRGTGVVAYALIAGAILFYLAEKFNRPLTPSLSNEGLETSEKSLERLGTPLSGKDLSEVSMWRGLCIGLFQCLALVPGMSRSGSTISGGLFMNLSRENAIRFSFLLSLPIIFGSGFKKLFDVLQDGTWQSLDYSLLIASFFAFISGLCAIHFLLKFLKNHSLNYFGIYRIILAIIILINF